MPLWFNGTETVEIGQGELEALLLYAPTPPPVPSLPNLEPYQFHAMVDLTGYAPDILAAIEADPDPTFKAAARSKYLYSTYYKREDPFVVSLGALVGLTPGQLDALWLDAGGL